MDNLLLFANQRMGGLYEESYDDGTLEHDSEPSTELLKEVLE
jgi:hypothetical protein